MDPVVLDTDVASLLHKGTLAGPLATRLIGREPLIISFVTFGELAKWAEIRNWGQHRREELTSWLSPHCGTARRCGSGRHLGGCPRQPSGAGDHGRSTTCGRFAVSVRVASNPAVFSSM